jgi:uncharacterized membrane protein SpoIIM required for sporulation
MSSGPPDPRKGTGAETELRELLARLPGGDVGALTLEQREQLHQLTRRVATLLARERTQQQDPETSRRLETLLVRAHATLARQPRGSLLAGLQSIVRWYAIEVPRTIREEWRLVVFALVLLYGFAAIAWYAVSRDLELAYSLMSPAAVTNEIEQLRALQPGEAFRGNFTFGLGESPGTAGWILAHNIGVGVLFFASGLLPVLFLGLVALNGMMLGTYTAVAGHWNQAGEISGILWCHGTLELQAFVLAGAAGMLLMRAWVMPGTRTRRSALAEESQRALRLITAVFPMLVIAGLIEGFVSPHADLRLRMLVAVVSGMALLAWILVPVRGARA